MSDEESAGSNDEEQEEEAGQFPVVNTGSSLRDVSVKTSGSTSIGDQNTINYHGQVHLTINQNIVIDNSSDPAALQNNILRLAIGGGQSSNAPHLPALDFISQVPVNAGRSVSINGVQVPAVEHHEVQEAGPSTTITELETTSLPEVQTVNSGTPSEASTEENASMTFLPIDNNRDVKDAGPPANITEPESTSMPVEQTVTSGSRNENLAMAVASTSNLPIENTASEGEASGSAVVAFGSDLVTEPWWSRVMPAENSSQKTVVFNELIDGVLDDMVEQVLASGQCTTSLADLDIPIENKIFGPVVLRGVFRTMNGAVGDLSQLHRSDDVVVSVEGEKLSLGVHLGIGFIEATAGYTLDYSRIHSEGTIKISCPSFKVSLVLTASGVAASGFKLTHFEIEEMGRTSVATDGPGVLNLIAGPTLTVLTNSFADLIRKALGSALRRALKRAIRKMNRRQLSV